MPITAARSKRSLNADEPRPTVGASLLAMDVNENAGCLNERVARRFFASRLAPTGNTSSRQK
ncbi:hypothetical protein DKY63_02870 [Pseudomonas putida]|uniref:Uncharacterized protein n=1 Tax=Pseudomonas putida TaxID=303 RepID=A0A2Z4RTE1_PSEPU|nr:hypothetical protein DKY63_02870 [Pseudomonas putida]